MATAWVKGSASILWTPVGGSEIQHKLAVPLGIVREIVPSRAWGEHYDWWAASKKHRRTVTVGLPTVYEIVWVNRLENQPVEFMDLLEQCKLFDIEAAYLPSESGPQYPFRVVEIMGSAPDAVTIQPDRDRYGGGEWEGAFRARRTDGGSFNALLATA
jgi:hypothetical protein